ncbi:MAG: putative glycoside hydrolase [Gemmatimonadaceae bacterium]
MPRPATALALLCLLPLAGVAAGCADDSRQAAAAPSPDAAGSGAAPGGTAAATGGRRATDSAAGELASAGAPAAHPASEASGIPASIAALRDPTKSPVIRALYVNRFAAQSSKRMRGLMGVADSTEINALVIDMKDEFGLNYPSANPAFARNAGSGNGMVRDPKALIDSLHAHGILAIARIVVFKDPVTARVNPAWTIRQPNGEPWRDHKGFTWVNPYHHDLWNYNIGVAEELVTLGFDEIQWDYIRFPEPFASLPKQVFPGADGMSKPDALAAYLKEARERMHKVGVRSTADIFGLVTTVRGPLEVGQEWEKVAPVTDVLLPMVYPSHYPRGSLGVERPNAQPYDIVYKAIVATRARNQKLGITAPEHVRPWLQAFSLGKPDYGAAQVTAQKKAVYAAGYDGWVLWHPGSKYEIFLPALEKELVSRKTP